MQLSFPSLEGWADGGVVVGAVRSAVAAVPRDGLSLMPRRAVTFGGTKVTKIPTGEGPRDPPALWAAVSRNLIVVYRYLRYLR